MFSCQWRGDCVQYVPMKSLRLLLWAAFSLFCVSGGSAAEIVCVTVEDPNNYDAVHFLSDFADKELRPAGHKVTIVQGNQPKPTRLEGLGLALKNADLFIVFVRRATPPLADLEAIRAHLAAGKPLLGIRTANHGFAVSPKDPPLPEGCAAWPEFTPDVLGCENTGYETKGLPYRVALHPAAPKDSPLLEGVDAGSIRGYQSLYRVLPLAVDATPLLLGTAEGIEPAQPIAWTRFYGPAKARVFYTSLGAPEDMAQASVRRLIANAVRWTLGQL